MLIKAKTYKGIVIINIQFYIKNLELERKQTLACIYIRRRLAWSLRIN